MVNYAKVISDFCETEDYGYIDNYSGRYMFGRLCPAIHAGAETKTTTVIAKLTEYVLNLDAPAGDLAVLKEAVADAASDQFGLGYVVYFPALTQDAAAS